MNFKFKFFILRHKFFSFQVVFLILCFLWTNLRAFFFLFIKKLVNINWLFDSVYWFLFFLKKKFNYLGYLLIFNFLLFLY